MHRTGTVGMLLAVGLMAGGCGSSSSGTEGAGGRSGDTSTITCSPLLACSGDQACCVPLSGSADPTCAVHCPQGTSTVACDGPEDCGGSPCCGSLTMGYQCSTGEMCSPGISQRCHGRNDCSGANCISSTFGKTPLDSCQL